MRKKLVLLILSLVLVSGCAHFRDVLVNDRGQKIVCESEGFGLFFCLMANNKYRNCVEEAEKKGYRIKESTGEETRQKKRGAAL